MGDLEEEWGDPRLSYSFSPKVFPWDLRESWSDSAGMSNRRTFIKEIIEANGWTNASFYSQAYTEVSQMITCFSRMTPEKLKYLRGLGKPKEEKKEDTKPEMEEEPDLGIRRKPVTDASIAFRPRTPSPLEFSGNIDLAIEQIWNGTQSPALSREEVKGVTLLMSSVGPIPDHIAEKMVLDNSDRVGKREAELTLNEGDKNIVIRTKKTIPISNKENGPTKLVDHEHVDKVGRLTARAEMIAKRSHRTWQSVQGLMYGGLSNKAWTTAVAKALAPY